jgi:hypothetical protein
MSSNPPTMSDLIRMARARAGGNTGSTNNGPWSDEEVADYLTDAVSELHDLLLAVYGEDHIVKTVEVPLAAGQSYFSWIDAVNGVNAPSVGMPWRVIRIDWVTGTPETPDSMTGGGGIDALEPDIPFTPMHRYQLTAERLEKRAQDWRTWEPRYDLRGTTVHFNPKPDRDVTLRIFYVPPPQAISAGSATLEPWYQHHDRLLVVSAAISLRDREETDAGMLMAEKDRLIAHIRANASPRDMGQPPTIVDAMGLGYLLGSSDVLAGSMRLP